MMSQMSSGNLIIIYANIKTHQTLNRMKTTKDIIIL